MKQEKILLEDDFSKKHPKIGYNKLIKKLVSELSLKIVDLMREFDSS